MWKQGEGRMRWMCSGYLATLLNTTAFHWRKGAPQGDRLARRHAPLRNDSCLQHNKGTKELFFYTFLKVVLKILYKELQTMTKMFLACY